MLQRSLSTDVIMFVHQFVSLSYQHTQAVEGTFYLSSISYT